MVFLFLVGGIFGVLVGVMILMIVSNVVEIDMFVSWWFVLVFFLILIGIGIVFGFYFVSCVVKMDLIEVLCYD